MGLAQHACQASDPVGAGLPAKGPLAFGLWTLGSTLGYLRWQASAYKDQGAVKMFFIAAYCNSMMVFASQMSPR